MIKRKRHKATRSSDEIQITPTEGDVTFVSHPREIHMYKLTEDEVVTLESAGNYKTLTLTLFSLCAGIFFTALFTVITVSNLSIKTYDTLIIALFVTGIGALLFFGGAFLAWKKAKGTLNRIKVTKGIRS